MARDPVSEFFWDLGVDTKDTVVGWFSGPASEAALDAADSAIEFTAKSLFAGTMFLGSLPEWFAQSVAHLIYPITDPWLNPYFPEDSRAEQVGNWNWSGSTMSNDWAVIVFERLGDPFNMEGSGQYIETISTPFHMFGVTGNVEVVAAWSWEYA